MSRYDDLYDDFDYDFDDDRKDIGKWIVTFSLIALITVALAVAFVQINRSVTTETLASYHYTVGALSAEDGKPEEGKSSLYTKETITLDELTCKPTVAAEIEYQVFFYDKEDAFVGATSVRTGDFDAKSASIPESAVSARILIMPTEDEEITFFEIGGYADMLKVTFAK